MKMELKNKIKDEKTKSFLEVMGQRKTIQLTRITNNMRNNSCDDCRQIFSTKGKEMLPEDFCKDCQPMAEKKFKIITKLMNEYNRRIEQ